MDGIFFCRSDSILLLLKDNFRISVFPYLRGWNPLMLRGFHQIRNVPLPYRPVFGYLPDPARARRMTASYRRGSCSIGFHPVTGQDMTKSTISAAFPAPYLLRM